MKRARTTSRNQPRLGSRPTIKKATSEVERSAVRRCARQVEANPIDDRKSQSAFRNPQSAILLGAHMSIGGGVHRAIERACSIQCTAMQIFVKNNMQWFARPLTQDEIISFLEHRQRTELR